MSLINTPNSERLHIAIFGKRNSGKSSLINAITGQDAALVSDVLGTTTDPVYKPMEVYPIGPVVFIDTAGIDDEGEIGALRVDKTKFAAQKTDIALMVFDSEDTKAEEEWIAMLKEKNVPVIAVLNKADVIENVDALARKLREKLKLTTVVVSAKQNKGITELKEEIIRAVPEDFDKKDITGNLVSEGDVVLLVMPQDIQAPKGRLILPQLQTTRELLDKKCIVVSITTDKIDKALSSLKEPPKLIITDSQVFKIVYEKKPEKSILTSFSILMAAHKGDIDTFVKGANAIDSLTEKSRVLIAEACTHVPLTEDIGRIQIPRMLRKRTGEAINIDIVRGVDFPKDLSKYDLIIHCGGCMFNRKYVLSRINQSVSQGVPITNYGVIMAKMNGILDEVAF